jgi:elongation factor G
MPRYTTEDIRNIALVGHSGSGKTTLLEKLLENAGDIGTAGGVERGDTVSDFEPLERERGHSLNTSLASVDHGKLHLNFIDCPGFPDFRGQTLAALDAVETAAVVVNAQHGIEMVTHRMMARARQRRRCRMIVINRIDAEDLDLEGLVRDIRETFGNECLPLNLPAEGGNSVVDCFFEPSGESDFFSVAEAHTQITDQVVEVDEELMAEYLDEGKVEPGRLHDAFEKAMREGHLVPICFVSARTGAGLPELLNVLEHLMPNPAEGNPPVFYRGQGNEAEAVEAVPDPKQHAIAHVFKLTNDPFVGKLSIFRIYQGTINKDSQLYIGEGRKPFKVGHLFKMHGKEHLEVDSGIPGDICAVAKVEDMPFDAVLHDSHDEDDWHLKPVDFPQPMYGLAVEPVSRGHEQKLSTALNKLAEEDPCFRVEHNKELNETVIRGLGDLHLRIMLDRMKSRYNVEVKTHPPRVPYRETISKKAEGHCRHKKQTGGAGQFGEVYLRIEPLKRGEGFEFVNKVVGGAIPTPLIPAVEKGIRQVLDTGAVAGYPMQDVRVTVYDGKHHPVDSKEVAFVTAGRKAFLDAIGKAKPVVLEPIVNVDVVVPEDRMGDITGSLSSRRGRINGQDVLRGGMISISGQAPMGEIRDYQSELKSLTGGQGSFTMEFSHYDPVPPNVQQELADAYRPKAED